MHRIGARQLVSGDDGAGFSVEAAEDAVTLRAKFDTSDVFDAHHTTERCFADNNLAELFGRGETTAGTHRVGKLLTLGGRFAANLTGGIDGVL